MTVDFYRRLALPTLDVYDNLPDEEVPDEQEEPARTFLDGLWNDGLDLSINRRGLVMERVIVPDTDAFPTRNRFPYPTWLPRKVASRPTPKPTYTPRQRLPRLAISQKQFLQYRDRIVPLANRFIDVWDKRMAGNRRLPDAILFGSKETRISFISGCGWAAHEMSRLCARVDRLQNVVLSKPRVQMP